MTALVSDLVKLVEHEDRATLAALRRGLGKPPGSAGEMYPFVIPRLAERQRDLPGWSWEEQCHFIVAALFAWHSVRPDAGEQRGRDFGASARRLKEAMPNADGPERRFVALLNAEREDVPEHLRSMIGLLRAHEIAVDWERLLADLTRWSAPSRHVQAAWARSFWRATPAESGPADTGEEAETAAD
jgi:CRISPR system Cascade subunit CasB